MNFADIIDSIRELFYIRALTICIHTEEVPIYVHV